MKIILETPRLVLREFLETDAEDMFRLNNDPEVIRYTGDPPFQSIVEATSFIKGYNPYKKFGYGRWSVQLKENGQYLGWCGLSYNANAHETDLGFRLLREKWNLGFATEAAANCVEYGFHQLNLLKIVGRAMKENKASIRILEKVGMKFEKLFEAHGTECIQYSITKKQHEEFN